MMRFGKLAVTLLLFWGQVDAQGLRDPTLPPAEAGLGSPSSVGQSVSLIPGVMTIVVRNGHRYLAVGTRLYAQGQKLGQAQIERITETAVWLREGGVSRKVSQYPGIERKNTSDFSISGGD